MQNQPLSPPTPPSELELVLQAKAGDSQAFSRLSKQYSAVLRGRASRYSNIVGVDTEDFVQEGMFALYRAVIAFDPSAGVQFRTYATTCIHNSMASAIKKHMRGLAGQGALTLEEMDEYRLHQQTSLHAAQMAVEDLFIQQETSDYRQRQIQDRLSAFERQILGLYLCGQTYQQIADAMSSTTKAVDNALQRVRRKLQASH